MLDLKTPQILVEGLELGPESEFLTSITLDCDARDFKGSTLRNTAWSTVQT